MITVQTRNLLFPDYFASHYKDYGKRSFSLCLSRGISLSKRKFIIISNWYIFFFNGKTKREPEQKRKNKLWNNIEKDRERERESGCCRCVISYHCYFLLPSSFHLLIKMLGMLHQNFFTSFLCLSFAVPNYRRKKVGEKTAHDAQLKYVCAFTRTRAI